MSGKLVLFKRLALYKCIRKKYVFLMNTFGRFILRKYVKQTNFCIFSNDCFGAEVYRWLQIQYNTPFVGLMLMAPCYLKFLGDPKKYLFSELTFIDSSRYVEMNKFRKHNNYYPLGLLDDIEIHFLHYQTTKEAAYKWNKRVQRVDFDKLRIKFSVDKDYSGSDQLYIFEELQLQGSLSISKYSYQFSKNNIVVPENVLDATVTFRLSLRHFNLIGWLNEGRIHFHNWYERFLAKLLFYTLIR